jgi:hypothetical protein
MARAGSSTRTQQRWTLVRAVAVAELAPASRSWLSLDAIMACMLDVFMIGPLPFDVSS